MSFDKASDESLRKMLEIQWQDHFQTRSQTWKALEITAILAVALVGLDWKIDNQLVTVVASFLLLLVAQFGISVTFRHRNVEVNKFKIISSIEKQLGVADESLTPPQPLRWRTIFNFRKSNTSLFILRTLLVIQLFAIGYAILLLI